MLYKAAGRGTFPLGSEYSNASLQDGGITPEQKFPGLKKYPPVKSTQPQLPGTRPGSGTTPRSGGGALGGVLIGVGPILVDIYCGEAENPNEWVCGRKLERYLEDFDEFDEFAWQRDLRRWALVAYDAVRQGVPTYVAALDAPQPEVRSRAACLLGWFPEERAVALGPLVRLLTAERDPAVAATAAIAAGLLGAGDGDRVDDRVDDAAGAGGDGDSWEMLDRRLGDPEQVVRWAAGIGLGRLRPVPGDRAVAGLYACVGHRGPLPAEAAAVPYLQGDLVGLAAGVLGELDAAAAPQRLDALLDLAVVWPEPAEVLRFPVPLVGAILKIAFPVVVPDGTEFADLSVVQRRVVSVLVTATNVFRWENTGEQLVEHGLPGDLEQLRAYAGLG
jgi:hypothetical protein